MAIPIGSLLEDIDITAMLDGPAWLADSHKEFERMMPDFGETYPFGYKIVLKYGDYDEGCEALIAAIRYRKVKL